MKHSILITGVTGTGKSTISKQLQIIGYEAHDIENIDGLFAMYRKDTREPFEDYDNKDPEKMKNASWLCDIDKLKEFLSKQMNDIAFYCGIASNMDEVIPIFNQVIVLQTTPEALHQRLSNREGTDDMGGTEESRQVVLGWKDWWEKKMADRGATILNAEGTPEEIAERIIKLVSHDDLRESGDHFELKEDLRKS